MRLNYMMLVLRVLFGRKATIQDPEQFVEKINQLERLDRRKDLKRHGSMTSMFSLASKKFGGGSERN